MSTQNHHYKNAYEFAFEKFRNNDVMHPQILLNSLQFNYSIPFHLNI